MTGQREPRVVDDMSWENSVGRQQEVRDRARSVPHQVKNRIYKFEFVKLVKFDRFDQFFTLKVF